MRSAIYRGEVVHSRFQPKRHRLRYDVFCLLIDIDELPALDRTLKLFGHNRRALFSFRDNDHGSLDGSLGLKEWALAHVREAGIADEDIRIEILCYPRILGYVFNPLTVFYCRRGNGELAAILYEVCNTFHERHTYVIPCVGSGEGSVRHACDKEFYVSPFMPMDCTYHFAIDPPEDRVAVRITETQGADKMLYAAFEGAREPLTDRTLLRVFFRYPLMTLKIMAGIHFEAVRLVLKGLPIFRHSPAEHRVASSQVPAVRPGE